jgi:hypothetical protein
VEQQEAVKSARAGLSLLDGTSIGLSKKRPRRPKKPRQSPRKPLEQPRYLKT